LIGEHRKFAVVEVLELTWPSSLEIPSKRFRLLVVGDTSKLSKQAVSDFASAALERGMVYCCAWGEGCERFHDIVDEVIVQDDLGPRRFCGSDPDDVIMTTSHADEPLEEALFYIAALAAPTKGFQTDSDFRVVVCVGNSDWAAEARTFLESMPYLK
jgi:hypothetical protein